MSELPQHLASPATGANRAAVLADGEHYPQVIADVVAEFTNAGWDVAGVIVVGGSEKLRGDADYGVPAISGDTALDAVVRGCRELAPDCVIDVSDEPVLVFEERARIIASVCDMGIDYYGADSIVRAPTYEPVAVPSLAIIGTGKRIGKTAISAHVARLADEALGGNGDVLVVAMGRGGPREPIVINRAAGALGVEQLLEISRGGSHAASDYLEDAALTGLTTIGCRRAGGGLLGVPVRSNVSEGARLAESLEPRLAIFEGSGSCIPPVLADCTVLLASTARPRDLFGDFGRYRLLRSNLVLVVGDDRAAAADMCTRVELLHPNLQAVAVSLVATPVEDVAGRSIAVFTTAPESIGPTLMRRFDALGADLQLLSHSLASRDELRRDVNRAVERGVECFVVEIKAAGIDVVAEAAAGHGIDVVFLDNPPFPHDDSLDLDALLTQVCLDVAGTPV